MTFPNLLKKQATQILAYKAVSTEQVRSLESIAAKNAGCCMFELMTRAGEAAYAALLKQWPNVQNILVVAGNGNNAGDGYVLAKLALADSKNVIVMCEDPSRVLSGDAGIAQTQWLSSGGQSIVFDAISFNQFDVLVDGLLGTGVTGSVKAAFFEVIKSINQSNKPVLSLDLPSGMLADTGQPLPICVQACMTVSFIAPKLGLLTGIGKTYCGQLDLADLSISKEFYKLAQSKAQIVNWSMLQALPSRPIHSNKGTFGKLLCIGGNQGMPGSIRLSAEAALRTGAGLVKVFCHPTSQLNVAQGRPEIMLCHDDLQQAFNWATTIVIGPGLGQDVWALQQFNLLIKLLEKHPKPLVMDADALNLLANKQNQDNSLQVLVNLPACVLTPHPGEAARLLASSIIDIENDRYTSCERIASEFHSTCVLKGAGTIIYAQPSNTKNSREMKKVSWVCNGGNPGMATAGMGDVLTGVIGALLAQGLSEQQSAIYGVCAHAEAGDRLARQYGQCGMIASDLFQPLRAIINNL